MRKLRALPAPITYVGDAAAKRLIELDLSVEILTEAVIYGQMERDGCSSLDPPTFPGTTAWAATNRALRAILMRNRAWTLSNANNFCTTISPTGEVAIAVATGDDGTGREHEASNFKNKRGPTARRAVETNQMLLFEIVQADTMPVVPSKTWILLVSRKADQVFSEMLLPRSLDESGRVEAWAERIILPTINLNDAPKKLTIPSEPEGGAEIEIDVTRRAS